MISSNHANGEGVFAPCSLHIFARCSRLPWIFPSLLPYNFFSAPFSFLLARCSFLSPPVLMHVGLLCIALRLLLDQNSDWIIIHISNNKLTRTMKVGQNILVVMPNMYTKWLHSKKNSYWKCDFLAKFHWVKSKFKSLHIYIVQEKAGGLTPTSSGIFNFLPMLPDFGACSL